ncbi:MAG: NAD(+)/NADH kinase [Lachnospiraceae bacterium]|nr:NAD(+)/NADH kinase [Lachnospiraceae bacterium]
MKKFYIISNTVKDKDNLVTSKLIKSLKKHGLEYNLRDETGTKKGSYNFKYTDASKIDKDTDCIIVIGGDGTLIQAARDLAVIDIPIIGINLGYLGYLAEVEPDGIDEMISMIENNNFKIESRIMLTGDIYRDGKLIYEDISLNDIVCSRSSVLKIIDFKVYVNDEFLNLYSADGIIISTPTGSTAYNLSAGGPIVEPGANIIVITPICNHNLGSRSIVLSADSNIKIEICEDRHNENNKTALYFDGETLFELAKGDVIKIRKSKLCTRIMKLNRRSFVEVLHNKMN